MTTHLVSLVHTAYPTVYGFLPHLRRGGYLSGTAPHASIGYRSGGGFPRGAIERYWPPLESNACRIARRLPPSSADKRESTFIYIEKEREREREIREVGYRESPPRGFNTASGVNRAENKLPIALAIIPADFPGKHRLAV